MELARPYGTLRLELRLGTDELTEAAALRLDPATVTVTVFDAVTVIVGGPHWLPELEMETPLLGSEPAPMLAVEAGTAPSLPDASGVESGSGLTNTVE